MKVEGPRELILLPSMKATPGPKGELFLTKKYLEGAELYQRYWPGPVTSLIALDSRPSTDLDTIDVTARFEGPKGPRGDESGPWSHRIEFRPSRIDHLAERISGAAAVFGFLSPLEFEVAELCRRLGVPLVMASEYTLRTELQVIDAEVRNPLLRARRKAWTVGAELKRLLMLRMIDGIQCSGPTFARYRHFNSNALQYHDNRVAVSDVIDDRSLKAKLESLMTGQPLRLVYGGRFVGMKGVTYLPKVATALRERGLSFSFDVYGDGPLKAELEAEIERRKLAPVMRLKGVVDFRTGWLPTLRNHVDLFVCCHPQGDPSSTYTEVMSCGVPIAGFANEAFAMIARYSRAGWAVPMKDHRALADRIVQLDKSRNEIATASLQARGFASEHAFERTFERRIRHVLNVSRMPFSARLEAVGL